MSIHTFSPFRIAMILPLLAGLAVAGERPVAQEDLIKDIQAYEDYIDEIHANPYRLITRESFHDRAEKLKNEISRLKTDRLSTYHCFLYLQELAAGIQDGHTRIEIPFHVFTGEETVFPLKLKMIDGKAFALDNYGPDALPPYCSILAINKIPIDTLFMKCSRLFHTSRPRARSLFFEDYFHILLIQYLNINPPWRVEYTLDTKVETAEIDGIPLKTYSQAGPRIGKRYRHYSISIQGREIPVLDIPGFAYGKSEDFEHFIDTFFKQYADAPYLVIDLRENSGGSGYWGFYLMDHFEESPYQIAKVFKFKVSDMMRNSPYASKAGHRLKDKKNGEYVEAVDHKVRVPHRTPHKFKGKVFLLISEKTFSAGAVFAAVFKANAMGLIIGRETSGRISLCSDPVTVTLLHTGLKATIPVAIYTLPGENPDRGVMPDIAVSRTIDDYRLGRDVEMDKLKELIKLDLME